jgi:type VI protein secretion system component VasF
MDPLTPEDARIDARARRTRAIILWVMAAFIAAPIVGFLIFGRGSAPRP